MFESEKAVKFSYREFSYMKIYLLNYVWGFNMKSQLCLFINFTSNKKHDTRSSTRLNFIAIFTCEWAQHPTIFNDNDNRDECGIIIMNIQRKCERKEVIFKKKLEKEESEVDLSNVQKKIELEFKANKNFRTLS